MLKHCCTIFFRDIFFQVLLVNFLIYVNIIVNYNIFIYSKSPKNVCKIYVEGNITCQYKRATNLNYQAINVPKNRGIHRVAYAKQATMDQ